MLAHQCSLVDRTSSQVLECSGPPAGNFTQYAKKNGEYKILPTVLSHKTSHIRNIPENTSAPKFEISKCQHHHQASTQKQPTIMRMYVIHHVPSELIEDNLRLSTLSL